MNHKRWFRTNENKRAAILWFSPSTKGDNLACLGYHQEFYITKRLATAAAFSIFFKIKFKPKNVNPGRI